MHPLHILQKDRDEALTLAIASVHRPSSLYWPRLGAQSVAGPTRLAFHTTADQRQLPYLASIGAQPPVPSALQLFMWEWSKAGASPSDFDSDVEHAWSPLVVHKTRRSLRAVHFHPHGAPLMLTAEVSAEEMTSVQKEGHIP